MELRPESEGTDSMGRKNACQREKECGREGGNTRSSNRMTRVKRYEKSIFSPSSIDTFSLSSSFSIPIASERCRKVVPSRRNPFTLNSLFL